MVRLLPWKGHSPVQDKLPEEDKEQNQENGGLGRKEEMTRAVL